MNKKGFDIMKKLLALVCAAVLTVSFAGCAKNGSDGEGNTEKNVSDTEKKVYKISSDNSFAPFEFLDSETNEYIGLDMDILAAIAKDQGFSYEMKNEGFDAAMGSVQSGQADAMIAGMTINDERKKTFDFSDGYFEDGQIMVVRSDSDIQSLDDLKGKSVAAKTSTISAEITEAYSKEYGFTLVYYEDSPTMYTAVESGTNVACFEDKSVVGWAIKESGLKLKTVGDVVKPGYYGFAVRKGTCPELIEMFNRGLENIKASGEYDVILKKYGY